jgi:putative hydrolase of the HAD superfamily
MAANSTLMPMKLRGVLFDLDGTLADTAGAEREAWDAIGDVIERHLPTVDRHELYERYAAVFEPHWTAYLEGRIDFGEYRWNRLNDAIEPWGSLDETLFLAYRSEKRNGLQNLRLFDDALPTLRTIRRLGLVVGLLTNGPSELQRRKLAITLLEPELDAVAISEEIGVAKPDPAAFRAALRMIDCESREVAMVGDSPVYDIAGAIDADLAAAVLVTGGLDLSADGARVVRTLSEVPGALELSGS